MAEPAAQPDPITQAALRTLKDIAEPPPVSWLPQTWGWAVVAFLIAAVAGILFVRWLRRYRADRYRREALRELDALGSSPNSQQNIEAVAVLLKRVALAVYPRQKVASLSGSKWVEFLKSQDGGQLGRPLAEMLDDAEYSGSDHVSSPASPPAEAVVAAARRWIEGHHVRA